MTETLEQAAEEHVEEPPPDPHSLRNNPALKDLTFGQLNLLEAFIEAPTGTPYSDVITSRCPTPRDAYDTDRDARELQARGIILDYGTISAPVKFGAVGVAILNGCLKRGKKSYLQSNSSG